MATTTNRARCVTCNKERSTFRCEGCLQTFCFNHSGDHRQELNKQLEEVEGTRDLIRQTITEQTSEPQKHSLIQQIDQWECDSIHKIRQTAEDARQLLLKHTAGHINEIEVKLKKFTDQIRQSREENDFVEPDLNQWKEELTQLTEQLAKPSNIGIRQSVTPLVTKIYADVPPPLYIPKINANAKWTQNGFTVAGGNGQGNGLNQLSNSLGLYVDNEQTIYIADQSNCRIVAWKSGATSGQIVAGGNGPGNRNDQLSNPQDVIADTESDSLIICDYGNKRVVTWPRRNGTSGETIISDINCWGLSMDNNRYLYVSDYTKHEVRRWKMRDTRGTLVAGGNGEGNRLDQLNGPTYIFVDQDHSVYVSDSKNHRVMKWVEGAKEGIVVAGGQGAGNGLTQFSSPRGVVVDQLGTVYVADCINYRVMCWSKGATTGTVVVGGNGFGKRANQLYNPVGISFDSQGNLYVVDQTNHRVQKFNIDPSSNT